MYIGKYLQCNGFYEKGNPWNSMETIWWIHSIPFHRFHGIPFVKFHRTKPYEYLTSYHQCVELYVSPTNGFRRSLSLSWQMPSPHTVNLWNHSIDIRTKHTYPPSGCETSDGSRSSNGWVYVMIFEIWNNSDWIGWLSAIARTTWRVNYAKWVNLLDFGISEYISIFLLLTMCCLPPTLIRNQYNDMVWGGCMERFYIYLTHSEESWAIESGVPSSTCHHYFWLNNKHICYPLLHRISTQSRLRIAVSVSCKGSNSFMMMMILYMCLQVTQRWK